MRWRSFTVIYFPNAYPSSPSIPSCPCFWRLSCSPPHPHQVQAPSLEPQGSTRLDCVLMFLWNLQVHSDWRPITYMGMGRGWWGGVLVDGGEGKNAHYNCCQHSLHICSSECINQQHDFICEGKKKQNPELDNISLSWDANTRTCFCFEKVSLYDLICLTERQLKCMETRFLASIKQTWINDDILDAPDWIL